MTLTNERLSEIVAGYSPPECECDDPLCPYFHTASYLDGDVEAFRMATELLSLRALSRVHPEEAEPDTDRRLKERDDFIVSRGLWDDFTKSLPTKSLQRFEGADEGWIEWRGGVCPVDDVVAIKVRDGTSYDAQRGTDFVWEHNASGADIVAYRIVRPSHGTGKPDGGGAP